jgi:thioredoxin-related protein
MFICRVIYNHLNIMKKVVLTLLLTIPLSLLQGQTAPVKWYTIEEATALAKTNPRPIFVDTFTDWCGWCKKLDKDTFSDPVIAGILNTKFYAVKFNAESREPVNFQGKTFINDGKIGPTHQLAYALMQGQTSYPTVVFLTANSELITPVPGYRAPKDIEPLLGYFSWMDWKTKSYGDFLKTFTGKVQ